MRPIKLLGIFLSVGLALICGGGCGGDRSSGVSAIVASQPGAPPPALPGLPDIADLQDSLPRARHVFF